MRKRLVLFWMRAFPGWTYKQASRMADKQINHLIEEGLINESDIDKE